MDNQLKEKVSETPFICGLQFSTNSQSYPATSINGGFNNTILLAGSSEDLYSSISSIQFTQTSSTTRAGSSYDQKLRFQFPNGDESMSQRIDQINKAKYMILSLTNANKIVIGRNDHEQNTDPDIKIENNTRVTQVTFSCTSIFPAGDYKSITGSLLPSLLPM